MKTVVSFGGGTNGTAMLANMVKHQIIPDLIIMADTGGEQPHTYSYIGYLNKWLKSKNYPEITLVKYMSKDGIEITLEEDCLKRNTLPSIAFGWKTCSQRWKIRPVEKYLKTHFKGEKIQMWIGFDAGEVRRVKANENKNIENYFPLIEWKWNRNRCIEAIKEAGLCLPGKSSCFFCPNMSKEEVLSLPDDLKERAMKIERNATQVLELKGLGRNKSWTDLINADRSQIKFDGDFEDWHSKPCECID